MALVAYAICAVSMHDFRAADVANTHAKDIARRLGDRKLFLEVGRVQAQTLLRQCDWDAALPLFQTCMEIAGELHDEGSVADALTGIGEVYRFKGQLHDSWQAHHRALDLRLKLKRPDRAAHSNLNLGIVASRLGNLPAAISKIQEALAILQVQGSRAVVADCLMEFGGALASMGQPVIATQLLAAVSKLRETISAPLPSPDRPDYVRFVAQARSRLDRAAFSQEWEIGRSMPLETIIQSALNVSTTGLL